MKRKVWWIAGAIVVAVALLGSLAFLSVYNGTEARLDRAVTHIVDEYGFEFSGQIPGWDRATRVDSKGYFRAPMGTESASEIVAVLRDACRSCKYEYRVYDEDLTQVDVSAGDPWIEVHNFTPDEQVGGWSAGTSFSRDNKGFGNPDVEPEATLLLTKLYKPSLWQRIKELWPW